MAKENIDEYIKMRTFQVMAPIEFNALDIRDIIYTALYGGGSRYWIDKIEITFEDSMPEEERERIAKSYRKEDIPFVKGASLLIFELDEDDRPYVLDLEHIKLGIEAMAEHKYSNGEDHKFAEYFRTKQWHAIDAEIADVFLQLCLFGETVYA